MPGFLSQSPCLNCNDPPSNIPIPPDPRKDSNCYSRKKNCCKKQCYCNFFDCRDKPAQCKTCSDFGCCSPNCAGCEYGTCKAAFREIQQKKIWNQVRVPSSLYMMNLAVLNVFGPRSYDATYSNMIHLDRLTERARPTQKGPMFFNMIPWNQSSDRLIPSRQVVVTPSHGNSRRGTKTAHQPGACSPGGVGVDIKHNSYARYLARKKGRVLRTTVIARKPAYGNKIQSYNIIDSTCCPLPPTPPCPPQPYFPRSCPCPCPCPPKPPCPPCMPCPTYVEPAPADRVDTCTCPACLPFNAQTYYDGLLGLQELPDLQQPQPEELEGDLEEEDLEEEEEGE